jgi:lipid-binding SYLF domain-containing protein
VKRDIRALVLLSVAVAILSGFCFYCPRAASAATARETDVSVDVALERFYKDVKGAKAFANAAKGMLVMPNVKKAGFIVGGQYGEGALRVFGRSVGYYSLAAGSFGLQVGAQSMDMIIVFMTEEALRQFEASPGWEAGVDGNIALIDIGAGGSIDTTTAKEPIVAFVFDVKGLMADLSLKGAKFTRLEK